MQLTRATGLVRGWCKACLGSAFTSWLVTFGAVQGPTWGKKGTRKELSGDVPKSRIGKLWGWLQPTHEDTLQLFPLTCVLCPLRKRAFCRKTWKYSWHLPQILLEMIQKSWKILRYVKLSRAWGSLPWPCPFSGRRVAGLACHRGESLIVCFGLSPQEFQPVLPTATSTVSCPQNAPEVMPWATSWPQPVIHLPTWLHLMMPPSLFLHRKIQFLLRKTSWGIFGWNWKNIWLSLETIWSLRTCGFPNIWSLKPSSLSEASEHQWQQTVLNFFDVSHMVQAWKNFLRGVRWIINYLIPEMCGPHLSFCHYVLIFNLLRLIYLCMYLFITLCKCEGYLF